MSYSNRRRQFNRFMAAAVVLGAIIPFAAWADRPTAPVACDPDNGGLTLPPGFCAVVVARNVGLARQMAVRPNGDLYVALDNARDGSTIGAVLALRDTDGDGRADVQQRFGPTGGNGIAWGNDQLFFSPDNRVLRWDFTGVDLVPSGAPATVVSGLPPFQKATLPVMLRAASFGVG